MRSIGDIDPQGASRPSRQAHHKSVDKARNAKFAELKMAWALQVAADKTLTQTALRIALVWPYWLNAKTLLGWPAQSTIAKTVSSQTRAVRAALKLLEERGHLLCTSDFRGGRQSNRYRIVLQDVVIFEDALPEADPEAGAALPVTPAQSNRAERHSHAAQTGADDPATPVRTCRGTLETTLEENKPVELARQLVDSPEAPREPRVSKEAANRILREFYEAKQVNENGHLLRKK